MANEITKESTRIYLCGECGLGYKEQQTAEKCEDHCKKYNSCSLDITSHAILK